MTDEQHLYARDIAKLAYEAGWTDADKLLVAVSVCIAESNGYADRTHVNDAGSIDRGLWQINDRWHPEVTDAQAFDPVFATTFARGLYRDRSYSFRAWNAYNDGSYKGERAMGYALNGVRNFLAAKYGFPVA